MAANVDVLAYVGRMMGISRIKASELTGLANDAFAEVLDPEHIIDQSPERDAVVEKEEEQVDLHTIAERLHVPVSEFRSWIEDEMIFIEYGANLSEGLAAEEPTALSATANFYCRWYNDVFLKHGSVLLSDEQHHRHGAQGEE
ncbi:hypothetical protein [Mucilaginibacter lappiensis]|uniref:hypothetical protein n=1 Tax=Mucilaginibacter lappiensis TaxID=354630 RepID=UPI003D230F32